jgi:hypothetical protein
MSWVKRSDCPDRFDAMCKAEFAQSADCLALDWVAVNFAKKQWGCWICAKFRGECAASLGTRDCCRDKVTKLASSVPDVIQVNVKRHVTDMARHVAAAEKFLPKCDVLCQPKIWFMNLCSIILLRTKTPLGHYSGCCIKKTAMRDIAFAFTR